MSEIKWIDIAIAKDVITGKIFSCVFPERSYADKGDRVSCQNSEGETVVGDILYAGMEMADDSLANAVLKALSNGKSHYEVRVLWSRHDFEPEEVETEDE